MPRLTSSFLIPQRPEQFQVRTLDNETYEQFREHKIHCP